MPGVRGHLRAVPAADAEERFRALFDGYFRELLGYALRRVSSPEDAADVVADTMLVAWRRMDQVPVDGTARLWLYGVARRVLANQRRGRLRRERLGERLRLQLLEVTPDLAESVATGATVNLALEALGADDRELLELTAWEGLDPREVAIVLDVPARTVRTRLHRARNRLRKQLGDAFDERGHVRDDQLARVAREER